MPAVTRHAFANFERFQLQLVEIHHFAPLAEAALHQQTGKSLFRSIRGGEVDVPEITPWVENMNGVEESVGVLIDFRDHTRPRVFPLVTFDESPQMQFLTRLELLSKAQYAAIAA